MGKSQTVKEYCKEKGIGLIDIRLAQLDPADLRGIPYVEGDRTHWKVPSWFPTEGEGIIFLDELNLAAQSIQAAAYQLILDRQLGDYKVPEGWIVIAAGNRIEDRVDVYELSPALKNRFIHVTLKPPTIEEWTKWAIEHNIDPRIIAFLNARPSLLYKPDPRVCAFPTPRSWEFCSQLIQDVQNVDQIMMLASTAVGVGAATELSAFIKLQRKLDLNRLLSDPDGCPLPQEIDELYALCSGLAEIFRQKQTKEMLSKLMRIALRLQPEFARLLLWFSKMGVSEAKWVRWFTELPEGDAITEKLKRYLY